jgi:hypothetical protein
LGEPGVAVPLSLSLPFDPLDGVRVVMIGLMTGGVVAVIGALTGGEGSTGAAEDSECVGELRKSYPSSAALI